MTPPSPEGPELHRRLLAGDPTASSHFAMAYFPSLVQWLCEHNRHVDPEWCQEAAGQTVLDFIKRPEKFDPARGDLDSYLHHAAQCDLKNVLRKERRHRHRDLESVELSPDGGKYLGMDDDPAFPLELAEAAAATAVPAEVLDGLSDAERLALELLRHGERRTAEFAAVLNFEHLPPDEQRREVKRVKDRLIKRLQRAGGGG